MGDDADKAKLYRERAAELRSQAPDAQSYEARESMISVAFSYESIADSLDRIEEAKRRLGLVKE